MKIWISLALFIPWLTCQASIIGEFNTNTEYAPGLHADLQGLQWLSFDQTLNIDRKTVEEGYGGLLDLGWRYATLAETKTLFESLTPSPPKNYSDPDHIPGALWFSQTIGSGYRDEVSPGLYATGVSYFFYFGEVGDCSFVSHATCIEHFGIGWIDQTISSELYSAEIPVISNIWFQNDRSQKEFQPDQLALMTSGHRFSNLLVRSIPEPTTLPLIAIGLISFLRLKKSNRPVNPSFHR
jgi:hypothetical protein